MLVTEEEAKTKGCQEAVTAAANFNLVSGQVGVVGMPAQPVFPRCIGSACMAWRWGETLDATYGPDSVGYCGKAGQP